MTRRKFLIGGGVVVLVVAAAAASFYFKKDKGVLVAAEAIKRHDLEGIVSASGKIQPKRLVNISADTPGRVVNLAVNEGDRIKKGQFLLQIDPKSLRTRVDSGAASMQAAQMSLDQMRQAVETARVQIDRGATEQAQRHRRALDVPSRPSRRHPIVEELPRRLAVAMSLPQDEVSRIFFPIAVAVDARTRLHSFVIEPRQLS